MTKRKVVRKRAPKRAPAKRKTLVEEAKELEPRNRNDNWYSRQPESVKKELDAFRDAYLKGSFGKVSKKQLWERVVLPKVEVGYSVFCNWLRTGRLSMN